MKRKATYTPVNGRKKRTREDIRKSAKKDVNEAFQLSVAGGSICLNESSADKIVQATPETSRLPISTGSRKSLRKAIAPLPENFTSGLTEQPSFNDTSPIPPTSSSIDESKARNVLTMSLTEKFIASKVSTLPSGVAEKLSSDVNQLVKDARPSTQKIEKVSDASKPSEVSSTMYSAISVTKNSAPRHTERQSYRAELTGSHVKFSSAESSSLASTDVPLGGNFAASTPNSYHRRKIFSDTLSPVKSGHFSTYKVEKAANALNHSEAEFNMYATGSCPKNKGSLLVQSQSYTKPPCVLSTVKSPPSSMPKKSTGKLRDRLPYNFPQPGQPTRFAIKESGNSRKVYLEETFIEPMPQTVLHSSVAARLPVRPSIVKATEASGAVIPPDVHHTEIPDTSRTFKKVSCFAPIRWTRGCHYRYLAEAIFNSAITTTVIALILFGLIQAINYCPAALNSTMNSLGAMNNQIHRWLEPSKICWGNPNEANYSALKCIEWRTCPIVAQCAEGKILRCADGFELRSEGCKMSDSLRKDVDEIVQTLQEKVVDYECFNGPEPVLPLSFLNVYPNVKFLDDQFAVYNERGVFGLRKELQDHISLPLTCSFQRSIAMMLRYSVEKIGIWNILCGFLLICFGALINYKRLVRYRNRVLQVKLRNLAYNYLIKRAGENNSPVPLHEIQRYALDRVGLHDKSDKVQSSVLKTLWPAIDSEIKRDLRVRVCYANIRGQQNIPSWCWISLDLQEGTVPPLPEPEVPRFLFFAT